MTPESGLSSAPADVASPVATGGSPADSSSAQATTGTPSLPDVQQAPVQESQPAPETDPLADVPSLDELNTLAEQNTPYAKALAQVRSAYETLKPQLSELTEKFKPFEPFVERFEKPEQLQELVELQEKLFGYERDDRNQLIPSTQQAAQFLAEKYPQHADFLAADLLDGLTRDPDTGRTLPRIDLALEAMRDDPARRAKALSILGGVEPSAVAPTWQPTPDELSVFVADPNNPTPQEKALQEIYRKLPFEEREELKLASPDYIKRQLEKEQFQQNLMRENETAKQLQAQQEQQRQQYVRQQAEQAGNQHVEQQFRAGFTEFANSIVERAKFIAPIDAQTAQAQNIPPEQVTAFNQQAEQINVGIGKMIATVTAALAVPDTSWVAQDFLRSLGVDDMTFQAFDAARREFADNSRMYGELSYGRNGQGTTDLGSVQSNASRAMKSMKGYGNLVSAPLFDLVSKFFEMKAGSYNSTLNGTAAVRPPVNGQNYDPTTAVTQRPQRSSDQIWDRAAIERMAL